MSNDTRTIDLVINNLTEEQFENVFSPDPNELWVTPDDTPEQLAQKVDKTTEANKTYGTDAQGNQITYSTPTIPTVGNGTITITQGGITKGTFTTNQGSNTTIALDAGGGGGGGAVDSVNGKTGVVVLTATDVGALPDSTVIPTVNNPTITITQGGVSKGSFTLNQSTGATIALDAGGGGSDVEAFTAAEVQTIWDNN